MGKLVLIGVIPVPHEKIEWNREECSKRGFPRIVPQEKRNGRLAVVGGGPSVLSYLDEIRECEEIWAINGACKMLRDHGIPSTLFAVDPHEIVAKWAVGATKALLCDRVCPEAFDAIEGDIRVFELANDVPGGVMTGSSTASVAFVLGPRLGFYQIDFFGCESSFEKSSHAYMDEKRPEVLRVEVAGKGYKTYPDFYLQAQEMSLIIKAFPKSFRVFGGGLLQAMIDHDDHDVTHVSQAFMDRIKPIDKVSECL